MNKDTRKLSKRVRKQGWEVYYTRNGHICFRSPSGEKVIGPGTASDWRALKNLKANLRRAGANL